MTGDRFTLPALSRGEERIVGEWARFKGELGSGMWIGDGGRRGIAVVGIIAGENAGVTNGDTGAVGKCGLVASTAYGWRCVLPGAGHCDEL